MKYLVVSDIHGSYYYASKIIDIINNENIDKLILLGDLYYHGPRNNVPKDYNPLEVCKLLNSLTIKIIHKWLFCKFCRWFIFILRNIRF